MKLADHHERPSRRRPFVGHRYQRDGRGDAGKASRFLFILKIMFILSKRFVSLENSVMAARRGVRCPVSAATLLGHCRRLPL